MKRITITIEENDDEVRALIVREGEPPVTINEQRDKFSMNIGWAHNEVVYKVWDNLMWYPGQ